MMSDIKKFESLEIDIPKEIYVLNGKSMRGVSGMILRFSNGKWDLTVQRTETYAPEHQKN